MSEAGDRERLERLLRRVAPRSTLVRSWPLTGGASARLTALEAVAPDGRRERLVVREHGTVDLEANPDVAADEFRLLQLLHSAGLRVPRPIHLGADAIVIEWVEGAPESAPRDLADYLAQLTEILIEIHEVDGSKLDLSFLRRRDALPRRGRGGADFDEAPIRAALERRWPLARRNEPVLLHGDFWPGNTLWNGGRLVAVVDWEDAAVGDPLADLANARLELLWAFGVEAMNDFTRRYSATRALDLTDLPSWDLFAALRLGPHLPDWNVDRATAETMRHRLGSFVAQALEAA